MLETINSFYDDIFKDTDKAKVIDVVKNKIYFDSTIFYAESGGQENDLGIISIEGKEINIVNVQYEKDSNIWRTAHYVEDSIDLRSILKKGDEVKLNINLERRKKLSAYHTASHLLYIAAEKVRNGINNNVIGCHIQEDSARFDFRVDDKFDREELLRIEYYLNEMIRNKLSIKNFYKNSESNERVWVCNGITIPCGGTHLDNTSHLNFLSVKRKGIGKGKERLICYTDSILQGENYA